MIFYDKMSNDPYTSANIVRRDSKQSDMSMSRKNGSVEYNMIFDDKIGYDLCNPTNTTRRDKGMTDETSDQKDELIDDNMLNAQ